jgi:hypothetical protein
MQLSGSAGVFETVGGDLWVNGKMSWPSDRASVHETEPSVSTCLARRVTRFPPNASAHGGSGRGQHRGGGSSTSDLQGQKSDSQDTYN